MFGSREAQIQTLSRVSPCPGAVQFLSNENWGIHNLEAEEQKSILCPEFVHVKRLSKLCPTVIISLLHHEDVNPDDGFSGSKVIPEFVQ